MLLSELLERLDAIAPASLAEPWDNVGLMLGDPTREIRSVLVALDPSQAVVEAAVAKRIDLILTHHPLFFEPINSIDFSMPQGSKLKSLIKHDIALVSLHTNLDQAFLVEHLAALLDLTDIELRGLWGCGFSRRPCALPDFAAGLPKTGARLVDAGRPVGKVGFCTGSGMSLWREALAAGCDTFITGDIRYHQALDAYEAGLNLIDLGHFGTEAPAMQAFAELLTEQFPNLEITSHPARDIFNPA